MANKLTFSKVMEKQGIVVNMLLSFVVFILIITSAPTAQFKGKGVHPDCPLPPLADEEYDASKDTSMCSASRLTCITAWGSKNDCFDPSYNIRDSDMKCSAAKHLFQTTQAFYVISIFVSLAIFLCTLLALLDYVPKIAVVVLSSLNTVFSLLPWVCMTALWYKNYCGGAVVNFNTRGKPDTIAYGHVLRDNYNRSAAYIFTLIAWSIQVIALACLFIL